MFLTEFKSLLAACPGHSFRLQLPRGEAVPVSFHITEIGLVRKEFLDCGGRKHTVETCQLQVWVGPDEDHRLTNQKMAGILDKAAAFLTNDLLPLEFEYEDGLISQYPVKSWEMINETVVLHLEQKHTDCLAKDVCLPPGMADAEGSCCGSGGCCAPPAAKGSAFRDFDLLTTPRTANP